MCVGVEQLVCINLNLLECKCGKKLDKIVLESVLILTYWNVNTETLNEIWSLISVLILTYWNVNERTVRQLFFRGLSINLNLLECKLKPRTLH